MPAVKIRVAGKDYPHFGIKKGQRHYCWAFFKEPVQRSLTYPTKQQLRRAKQMKVTLIDCTGMGAVDPEDYAANLLIFTKSTRLQMHPGLLEEIKGWAYVKKLSELDYMANTIPSSWEFVDYTFLITGVTRAFTHQLVRTRTASFAQQTMRVLNVEGWEYAAGPTIDRSNKTLYDNCMSTIAHTYDLMIENGAAIEDARGVLPTNILTNIVMKCNHRVLAETLRKRSSPRPQGEYRDALEAMKAALFAVHPWAKLFLERDFDRSASDLDAAIQALPDNVSKEQKTAMIKLVDQLRNSA